MKKALEVRVGNVLKFENQVYRVIEIRTKGAAKAHNIIDLKLKSIPEGKFMERTFNPEEKVEEADVIRKKVTFSYKDESSLYFLDAETYEQYSLPREAVGKKELFLKDNAELEIDFNEGAPLSVVFPKRIRLRVSQAPKGIKESESTTPKQVTLENGMELTVPQFIETGDLVEVDSQTGKYVDRIKEGK